MFISVSCFCHDIKILASPVLEYEPSVLHSVDPFQFEISDKNVPISHAKRLSSTEVCGFKNDLFSNAFLAITNIHETFMNQKTC